MRSNGTWPLPSGNERLGRGDFARLAYRLARVQATGVLTIRPQGGSADVLVLRRGQLITTGNSGAAPRQTTARLERLAQCEGAFWHFDGGLAAYPPGASLRQYNLASWARMHFEAQLDAGSAASLVGELAGARLILRADMAPAPHSCDELDRRILGLLATPRRLDQLASLARVSRFRLLSFVYFLRAVGAVSAVGVAAPRPEPVRAVHAAAYRTLGVAPGAELDTVKRAYRRLARALHPDLHAKASADRRRQLERQLAAVNSAYRKVIERRTD